MLHGASVQELGPLAPAPGWPAFIPEAAARSRPTNRRTLLPAAHPAPGNVPRLDLTSGDPALTSQPHGSANNNTLQQPPFMIPLLAATAVCAALVTVLIGFHVKRTGQATATRSRSRTRQDDEGRHYMYSGSSGRPVEQTRSPACMQVWPVLLHY